MTSPISSLSKGKKSPSGHPRSYGKRQMPFRMPDYSSSERMLLNDITGHITSHSSGESSSESPAMTPRKLLLEPLNGSPREMYNSFNGHKKQSPLGLVPTPSKGNHPPPASIPSDLDLMSSMMQKITKLEKLNLYYSREIIEKDKRIKVLEEKNSLMEKSMKSTQKETPSQAAELEAKCLELKQQIYEMETFLADYGMIWVGDKTNPNSNKYLDDYDDADENGPVMSHGTTANGVWKPESSLSRGDFVPDYDLIIENVKDLNILAGDGEAKVLKTVGGAKLQVTDPIPLTLYKNGIMMFNGPFRPFTEVLTQRCLQDIMDGYFPSELQPRYPDGVPIKVTDRRFVLFKDPRLQEEFPGHGHLLGGEKQPSNLLKSDGDTIVTSSVSSVMSPRSSMMSSSLSNFNSADASHGSLEVTSELPGPRLSSEKFAQKLPKSVIRNGKVIDVRGPISDHLSGAESVPSSSSAELVETQVVQEMQKRMNLPEQERPPTARDVTTLRVKSEDGSKTLLIKMKFKETIGDLRRYIDRQRPNRKSPYVILSNFPPRTYSEGEQTLLECGLVPNANLFLQTKKTERKK